MKLSEGFSRAWLTRKVDKVQVTLKVLKLWKRSNFNSAKHRNKKHETGKQKVIRQKYKLKMKIYILESDVCRARCQKLKHFELFNYCVV